MLPKDTTPYGGEHVRGVFQNLTDVNNYKRTPRGFTNIMFFVPSLTKDNGITLYWMTGGEERVHLLLSECHLKSAHFPNNSTDTKTGKGY